MMITIILINQTFHLIEAWNPYFFEHLKKSEIQSFKITSLIKMIDVDEGCQIMEGLCNILKLVFSNEKCLFWYISTSKKTTFSFKFNFLKNLY